MNECAKMKHFFYIKASIKNLKTEITLMFMIFLDHKTTELTFIKWISI